MARKGKGYTGSHRKLSEAEKKADFEQDLDLLVSLCEDFDNGRIEYAFLIATQIQKILTEGQVAIQRRGSTSFPSPVSQDKSSSLSAHYLLTGFRLSGGPIAEGTFVPIFEMGTSAGWHKMKFSKWWAEPVFRASAAPPGTPPGLIPVNDSPTIPFEKRERLSRRLIIQTLRNHRGAHSLEDFPDLLEKIDGPDSWGGFGMIDEKTGQEFTTSDGTLDWKIGQLAATVRNIASEVLAAFGRIPTPS